MKLFSNTGAFIQTVGPRNAIDDTLALPLIIQRVFGQHILDPEWTWKRVILYQIVTLSLITYVILGTKEILSNTDDIQLIAEASYTYVVVGFCIVKYLSFVKARMSFCELYVKAKTTIFDTIHEDSPEKLFDVLRKEKKVVYIMFSMIAMPVISYVFRALWFYIQGERVTVSKTTSTLLPMTTPYYEIASTVHTIHMIVIACTYISIDTFFIFLLNLYCHASDSVAKKLVEKREEGESNEDYSRRLNDSLRKFYFGHVKLVEYLLILNKTFKWQALVPLISVMICLCIPMLTMSSGLDLAFVSNMVPVIAEIFAYNWFGEQIKTKASDLRDAVLNFDWVNLQLKDKKSFYVIVCFMHKEVRVTTAVGSELSLITMTSVLKASYQIFTMLQSFDH